MKKMIKPQDFVCRVLKVRQLTEDVKSIFFECNKDFNFVPGQFVNLKFEDPIGDEGLMQRAYSVASNPNGRKFELCVKIIPKGKGSTFIDKLQIGDKIEIKAPFGHCVIEDSNQDDLVMVATGTGIAPVKAILEHLASQNDKRKIEVFWGLRFEEDIYYKEEVRALFKSLPGLNFNLTLSKPGPNWDGLDGRVTAHVKNMNLDNLPDFYLCGAMPMVKEVMQLAKDKGIERKKIHVEIYG